MKLYTSVAVIFVCMAFITVSCDKEKEDGWEIAEKCGSAHCKNGGICIDGSCDCPDNYTGEYCENWVLKTCDTIDCNYGDCIDSLGGYCECPDKYEGERCEFLDYEKFEGKWNISQSCTSSGNANYVISINGTDFWYKPGQSIFLDTLFHRTKIEGTVEDSSFIMGNGSGAYVNDTIYMSFVVTDTNNVIVDSCTAVLTRL